MQNAELLDGVGVDPGSPVPAYYQLYEALRSRLSGGDPPPGTRLPTERALAQQFRLSRMTVRKALDRLERDGLLQRRRGDGTYVIEPRILARLRDVAGFTAELGARGYRVSTRVLDLSAVQPPSSVRAALGVQATPGLVVQLRRVRSLDGVPATLETAWLPMPECAPLLELDFTDRSLYRALEEHCGLSPHQATEQLAATVLDEFEAGQLGQRPQSPAFLVERTTIDERGRAIEQVRSLLRADRFTFTTALDLKGTEPAPATVSEVTPHE